MKQQLNNKTVTIQQDDWSIIQNDLVISTSVVSQGRGFFVDAKDTASTHKTAEALKTMFEDAKVHAERTYGCDVHSFATDKGRNNQKMRTELEKEDVLNLQDQDITLSSIMKLV